MAPYFTASQLAELHEARQTLSIRCARLQLRLQARRYKSERGKEFAFHRFSRRLGTLLARWHLRRSHDIAAAVTRQLAGDKNHVAQARRIARCLRHVQPIRSGNKDENSTRQLCISGIVMQCSYISCAFVASVILWALENCAPF